MKTFIVSLSLLAFALPTMAATKQNKPFIGTPSTRTQLLSCEIVKSKYSGKVYQKGDKAILAMAPKWASCQVKVVAVKQPVQATKTPAQIQLELEERNMALFGNPSGRVIVQQQPVTVPVPQGERLTTENRAREIANEEITRRQAEVLRQAEESARLRAEADRAAAQRATDEATRIAREAREAEQKRADEERERMRPDFVGEPIRDEVLSRPSPTLGHGRTPYRIGLRFDVKGTGHYILRCTNSQAIGTVGYSFGYFDRPTTISAYLEEFTNGLVPGVEYRCEVVIVSPQNFNGRMDVPVDIGPNGLPVSRPLVFTVPNS